MAVQSEQREDVAATRRDGLRIGAAAVIALFGPGAPAQPAAGDFITEAFRLRDDAVEAGDQPYGAVVVLDGRIAGQGRSRVVSDRNGDHHAERVALWHAQRELGRRDLSGAIIYSSSIPCMACQKALAAAGVARMIHGRDATDAGAPRGRS